MNLPVTGARPARLHDRYPDLGRGPLPVAPYVDPAYWELEKTHVFKKTWLHVGRVEEIPTAGDYFVKHLAACDTSVIVVRTRSGAVKAFHNVCSHRLNKVVYEPCGKVRKFFCKFHGWAYDLDGTLTGVPDEAAFEADFDKSDYGLTPVSCDVWEGFVFVNMDRAPQLSLRDFLAPMFGGLEGYPFHMFTACYSWSTVVKCNWKMVLDAFQETYHVGYVHGRSIADALDKDEAGSPHPIDGLVGDFHRRLSIAGNPKSVYGNPKAATAGSSGAAEALSGSQRPIATAALRLAQGGTKLSFDDVVLPEGLNWTGHPNWAFDINCVFPEFYLSTRPNYFQAYNFRPLSHDTTLFDARVYYPEMKTAGGRFYQEYMKVALRDVLLEDLSTLEHTQEAAETGAKDHIVLQDFEIMVRHGAVVVDRLIRAGLEADRAGR